MLVQFSSPLTRPALFLGSSVSRTRPRCSTEEARLSLAHEQTNVFLMTHFETSRRDQPFPGRQGVVTHTQAHDWPRCRAHITGDPPAGAETSSLFRLKRLRARPKCSTFIRAWIVHCLFGMHMTVPSGPKPPPPPTPSWSPQLSAVLLSRRAKCTPRSANKAPFRTARGGGAQLSHSAGARGHCARPPPPPPSGSTPAITHHWEPAVRTWLHGPPATTRRGCFSTL